jgi:hypothetical protein
VDAYTQEPGAFGSLVAGLMYRYNPPLTYSMFNDQSLVGHNTQVTPRAGGPVDEHGLPLEFTPGAQFGPSDVERQLFRAAQNFAGQNLYARCPCPPAFRSDAQAVPRSHEAGRGLPRYRPGRKPPAVPTGLPARGGWKAGKNFDRPRIFPSEAADTNPNASGISH